MIPCPDQFVVPPTTFSMQLRRPPPDRLERVFAPGRQEIHLVGALRWGVVLTWALTREDRHELIAWLEAFGTRGAQFDIWHLARPVPAGAIIGTPGLAGPSSQSTMTLTGLPTNTVALKTGDMIKVHGELHAVTGPVIVPASGTATAFVTPPRRVTAPASAVVEYVKPSIRVQVDASVAYQSTPGGGISATLSATQV